MIRQALPLKLFLTFIVAALVALSWSQRLDDYAVEITESNFKRALAAAALARAFNGAISVAQGTEVAIQPVGVGVTLTLGEILDPINDLVERFSALALVASVALLLQMTVGQIVSEVWASTLLSVFAFVYLIMLWRSSDPFADKVTRIFAFVVLARFLVAVALLVTHWADQAFLAPMHENAMRELDQTTVEVQTLQSQQTISQSEPDQSFLERTASGLENFMSSSRQSLDVEARLNELKDRVESSVEEIIRLIVVFTLQTILIPLGTAYLCLWLMQWAWRQRSGPPA